jgi:hypothetical protein
LKTARPATPIRLEEENALASNLPVTLAALALAGLATGARAQVVNPVFAAFHDVCMAADTDPTAVTTAAAGQGWSVGGVPGQPIPSFAVTDKITETTKIGEANLTLFSWKGAKGPITASECQMQVSKANLAALLTDAAATLGFAANENTPAKVVYQYSGPASAPHPLADKSQFDAAASGGGLYILTLSGAGKGAFLELLKIHK